MERSALKNLEDILEHLATQSRQAPAIVKKGILERAENTRKFPYSYETDKLREPPSDDFRAFVVYSYRVTYQINSAEKEIRIIRVRHTSREPLAY